MNEKKGGMAMSNFVITIGLNLEVTERKSAKRLQSGLGSNAMIRNYYH